MLNDGNMGSTKKTRSWLCIKEHVSGNSQVHAKEFLGGKNGIRKCSGMKKSGWGEDQRGRSSRIWEARGLLEIFCMWTKGEEFHVEDWEILTQLVYRHITYMWKGKEPQWWDIWQSKSVQKLAGEEHKFICLGVPYNMLNYIKPCCLQFHALLYQKTFTQTSSPPLSS